jgi:hypothetical protein
MSKRFVDTELDDKPWFNELPCRLKCAVQYIFRKCDSAGIWEPNYAVAAVYVGEGGFKEGEILSIDGGTQFEKLPNGKIFVVGFCDFQYGTLSEDCKPHKPIIQKLKKHGLYERVLKGFQKGFKTLQEKDKDKEEEKAKEKEPEKDFGKSENLLDEKYIIPQMWDVWKTSFPKYTADKENDYPALGKMLHFMMDQPHNHDPTDGNVQIKILNSFQLIADEVKKDTFWVNKPLKSIANNQQEFYNKIKNPANGKAGKKYDDNSIKQKLAERYGNRG